MRNPISIPRIFYSIELSEDSDEFIVDPKLFSI